MSNTTEHSRIETPAALTAVKCAATAKGKKIVVIALDLPGNADMAKLAIMVNVPSLRLALWDTQATGYDAMMEGGHQEPLLGPEGQAPVFGGITLDHHDADPDATAAALATQDEEDQAEASRIAEEEIADATAERVEEYIQERLPEFDQAGAAQRVEAKRRGRRAAAEKTEDVHPLVGTPQAPGDPALSSFLQEGKEGETFVDFVDRLDRGEV